MVDKPICELYVLLCEFGLSTGMKSMKDVEGCWEFQMDSEWWVAANGHRTQQLCSRDVDVPPFNFVLFYGDLPWPTAIVTPFGGSLIGGNDLNSLENDLIKAVTTATKNSQIG